MLFLETTLAFVKLENFSHRNHCHCPACKRLLAQRLGACAGAEGSSPSWDGLSDTLRNLSGSCSILAAASNSFHDNSAQKAGGALFLSDLGSAHFNCTARIQPPPTSQLIQVDKTGDNWTGNQVPSCTVHQGMVQFWQLCRQGWRF